MLITYFISTQLSASTAGNGPRPGLVVRVAPILEATDADCKPRLYMFESRPLNPGQRIGPFEIVSLLGRGGMGEVFLANDTRLNRKVAIKLLPAEFASDRERLIRFEQEAKTLASLDHPNILSIFDTGVHDRTPYLVSQFLEGSTLRDELSRGPLAQRRAVDYALQIANGLAAAHDRGVVHRDLKPENIFVAKNGRVKILDFGLAKLRSGGRKIEDRGRRTEGGGQTDAVTLVQTTEPGVVLGTVGYMSPEQVRGEEADYRSDLFAFGCVFYEMLTGNQVFRKETPVQTMNAILEEETPSLIDTKPGLSPALDRVVQRCLEKRPERRFQSSSDLAFALEMLSGSTTNLKLAQALMTSRAHPSYLLASVLAVFGLVLLGLGYFTGRWQKTGSEPVPQSWRGERLAGPAIAFHPVVSPDGNELAFRAMDEGLTQLAVMKLKSGEWQLLTTNRDRGLVLSMDWSRSGTEIYYDRATGVPHGIYRISAYGADDRLILENASLPQVLPDDTLLVSRLSTNRLRQINRYSLEEEPKPLNAFGSSRELGPFFRAMPGAREVVFFGWPGDQLDQSEGWWVLNLQSGQCKALPEPPPSLILDWTSPSMAGNPVDNSLLYVEPAHSTYRIMSVHLDRWENKRAVMSLTQAPMFLDVGSDGSLYLDQADRPTEILRLNGSQVLQRIPLPAGYERGHVLPLADGTLIMTSRVAGQYRLMRLSDRRPPSPFIQLSQESRDPLALLGPDRVLCRVGSSSNWMVVAVSAADGRILNRLPFIPADERLGGLAGSPDGKTIYYVDARTVWAVPLDGGEPQQIREGDGVAPDPRGEYLIIQVNQPQGNVLIRRSLSDGTEVEIPTKYPLTTWPITPNAIHSNGRIAVPIAPLDSWFWPAAVLDPATGDMELVPERDADMTRPGWDPQGNIVTASQSFRASLWRFRPEK